MAASLIQEETIYNWRYEGCVHISIHEKDGKYHFKAEEKEWISKKEMEMPSNRIFGEPLKSNFMSGCSFQYLTEAYDKYNEIKTLYKTAI